MSRSRTGTDGGLERFYVAESRSGFLRGDQPSLADWESAPNSAGLPRANLLAADLWPDGDEERFGIAEAVDRRPVRFDLEGGSKCLAGTDHLAGELVCGNR